MLEKWLAIPDLNLGVQFKLGGQRAAGSEQRTAAGDAGADDSRNRNTSSFGCAGERRSLILMMKDQRSPFSASPIAICLCRCFDALKCGGDVYLNLPRYNSSFHLETHKSDTYDCWKEG